MKPIKTIFILGTIVFLCIVGQFLPLILTQPYSVELMGFPVPYAFDRMVETLDGAPPTYSTRLNYALALADLIFLLAAVAAVMLWKRSVLGRDILLAIMCGIVGLAAFVYLRETTLWEEISMKGDPCFKAIEGKSPSYIIQNDRVCYIYDSTATDPTSYYKTLLGADAATFVDYQDGSGCGEDQAHIFCNGQIQKNK
ncbi:MAG: hypothetical protein ACEQSB_01160 [Undibacterium sp.]